MFLHIVCTLNSETLKIDRHRVAYKVILPYNSALTIMDIYREGILGISYRQQSKYSVIITITYTTQPLSRCQHHSPATTPPVSQSETEAPNRLHGTKAAKISVVLVRDATDRASLQGLFAKHSADPSIRPLIRHPSHRRLFSARETSTTAE